MTRGFATITPECEEVFDGVKGTDNLNYVIYEASAHDKKITVAESGIAGPDDAAAYAAQGADAVLVGEALVRTGDPRAGAAAMVAAGAAPTQAGPRG